MEYTLQKNKKKILPVIAGILFVTLFVKSFNEIKPLSVLNQDLSGEITVYAANTVNLEQAHIEELSAKKIDQRDINADVTNEERTRKIREYLSARNSPLADYAQEFVSAANTYGIDYRLVAAISIIESSGGIHCFRTFNAWGWGKSGFDSWTDGIWSVSKGLAKYYASGLDTPKEIAYRYCPPSALNWGNKVTYVMNVIENQ